MSYKKQNFVDGEILMADQLNYMEEAIAQTVAAIENGGGGAKLFYVNFTPSEDYGTSRKVSADKTVKEIVAAYRDGQKIIGRAVYSDSSEIIITPLTVIIEQAVVFSMSFRDVSFTITGLDSTAFGMDSDMWTATMTVIATVEQLEEKIAEAISTNDYEIGVGLKMTDNTLSVDSATDFEGDNTRPVEAAFMQSQIGNVEALLKTI